MSVDLQEAQLGAHETAQVDEIDVLPVEDDRVAEEVVRRVGEVVEVVGISLLKNSLSKLFNLQQHSEKSSQPGRLFFFLYIYMSVL